MEKDQQWSGGETKGQISALLSLRDNLPGALLLLNSLGRSQPFSFAPPHLLLKTSELPYKIKHFLTASHPVMVCYNRKHLVISKATFPTPRTSPHWAAWYKFPHSCLKRLLFYQSGFHQRKTKLFMAWQKLFRAMDIFNHQSLLKDARLLRKHIQAKGNMTTDWQQD